MSNTKWENCLNFVSAEIQRMGLVGVSLAVQHEGQSYSQGFGKTSVDNPLDVTPDTVFQIGSVTKTYTASVIMQLQEEGKLSLDDKVRQHLPWLALASEETSQNLTIRHLLNHTGGWDGDFFEDTGLGRDGIRLYIEKLKSRKQFALLGELVSYNNSAFAILAAIIEEICGKGLEAVFQEKIFAPLGMKKSFTNVLDAMPHRFAVGHTKAEQVRQVEAIWPTGRATFGMGSIYSSVNDQLRYAQMYLNRGILNEQRLLSEASIETMWTATANIRPKLNLGLAWFIEDLEGMKIYHHGGATYGQVALLAVIPEKNFAFAAMLNAGYSRQFLGQLRSLLIKEFLGIESPKPQSSKSTVEQREALHGRFDNQQVKLQIGSLGDSLVAQIIEKSTEEGKEDNALPPMSLGFINNNTLIVLDGDFKDNIIDIVRGDDGSVRFLRGSLRIYWRES